MLKQSQFKKIMENYRALLGSGASFATPFILMSNGSCPGINLHVLQTGLPNYHKVMFGIQGKMIHHIAGYGQSYEEALTRAMGETVERFAFNSSYHLYKDRLVKASYKELAGRANIVPLSYINTTNGQHPLFPPMQEDDEHEWLEVENLIDGKPLYYPYSLIGALPCTAPPIPRPAMSTGTATHISYERALINALSEAFQIDAFMQAWYGGASLAQLDWEALVSPAFKKNFDNAFTDKRDFSIIVLDNSIEGTPFKNYIAIFKNNQGNFPYCSVGLQGGLDSEGSLWRAILESAAIYINLKEVTLYRYDEIDALVEADVRQSSCNLDDTFLYWANFNEQDKKTAFLNRFISEKHVNFSASPKRSVEEELSLLLNMAKSRLKYLSFLDITPPELEKFGYKTVKMLAPELIPMSLPSLFYDNHPHFISKGANTHGTLPHPLP